MKTKHAAANEISQIMLLARRESDNGNSRGAVLHLKSALRVASQVDGSEGLTRRISRKLIKESVSAGELSKSRGDYKDAAVAYIDAGEAALTLSRDMGMYIIIPSRPARLFARAREMVSTGIRKNINADDCRELIGKIEQKLKFVSSGALLNKYF